MGVGMGPAGKGKGGAGGVGTKKKGISLGRLNMLARPKERR